DEIDLRVLDSVDTAAESRVVAGEILEQVREPVGPRVLPLVDSEHLVTVALEPQRQVGPDLTGRACDEDLHRLTPIKASLLNGREGYRAHRANPASRLDTGSVGYDQSVPSTRGARRSSGNRIERSVEGVVRAIHRAGTTGRGSRPGRGKGSQAQL